MITPRDLRDIAAYWGATCDYSYSGEFGTLEYCNRPVHEFIGAVLGHGIETVGDSFTVKVLLREAYQLTCEEMDETFKRTFGGLAQDWELTLEHIGYDKGGDHCEIYGYYVSKNSEDVRAEIKILPYGIAVSGEVQRNYKDHRITPITNISGAVAYLQSIGVYVPGTIREELVLF